MQVRSTLLDGEKLHQNSSKSSLKNLSSVLTPFSLRTTGSRRWRHSRLPQTPSPVKVFLINRKIPTHRYATLRSLRRSPSTPSNSHQKNNLASFRRSPRPGSAESAAQSISRRARRLAHLSRRPRIAKRLPCRPSKEGNCLQQRMSLRQTPIRTVPQPSSRAGLASLKTPRSM